MIMKTVGLYGNHGSRNRGSNDSETPNPVRSGVYFGWLMDCLGSLEPINWRSARSRAVALLRQLHRR
jgi:hypothetical protein